MRRLVTLATCSASRVETEYLGEFDVQKVGSATALEYWIPAERLEEFNSKIIGKIGT